MLKFLFFVENLNMSLLKFFGWDWRLGWTNIKGLSWFISDRSRFLKLTQQEADITEVHWRPIIFDKADKGGTMTGHYFHMDLLISQLIFKNNPTKHVDIGSRVDGFVAHVAAFRPIEIFDIRPMESKVDNIAFVQADFMVKDEKLKNYADSLSCLHAIEHFGLGRYNDPIDVNGHKKGLENMYHVLQQGGKFYFATPIGPLRVEFNGHRVFSIQYLLEIFKGKYKIDSFNFVDDKGDLHKNQALTETNIINNYGCNYGCGIFEMTKL